MTLVFTTIRKFFLEYFGYLFFPAIAAWVVYMYKNSSGVQPEDRTKIEMEATYYTGDSFNKDVDPEVIGLSSVELVRACIDPDFDLSTLEFDDLIKLCTHRQATGLSKERLIIPILRKLPDTIPPTNTLCQIGSLVSGKMIYKRGKETIDVQREIGRHLYETYFGKTIETSRENIARVAAENIDTILNPPNGSLSVDEKDRKDK